MSAMSARSEGSLESAIKATVLYDEFASGRRAKAYFDGLNIHSGERLPVSVSLWRFDVLTLSDVVEDSLAESVDADLVGVAVGSSQPLPNAVGEWLETWAVTRTVQDAALVLIHDVTRAVESAGCVGLGGLRSIAERHGLKLIWPQGIGGRWDKEGYTTSLWRREHVLTSTLNGILEKTAYEPHRQFGINE